MYLCAGSKGINDRWFWIEVEVYRKTPVFSSANASKNESSCSVRLQSQCGRSDD